MQEKSNIYSEYRETPVDRLARLLWEQCDWLVGFGVGATIVGLIWITFHLCIAH